MEAQASKDGRSHALAGGGVEEQGEPDVVVADAQLMQRVPLPLGEQTVAGPQALEQLRRVQDVAVESD
jgi:hypothetical protein